MPKFTKFGTDIAKTHGRYIDSLKAIVFDYMRQADKTNAVRSTAYLTLKKRTLEHQQDVSNAVDQMSEEVVSGAVRDALADYPTLVSEDLISASTANVKINRDMLKRALNNQIQRDYDRTNGFLVRFDSYRIAIQSSTGQSPRSAAYKAQLNVQEDLVFSYKDSLGRRWDESHYFYTTASKYATEAYNDLYFQITTNEGATQFSIQREDGKYDDVVFEAESYDEIRKQFLHPQSNARIVVSDSK